MRYFAWLLLACFHGTLVADVPSRAPEQSEIDTSGVVYTPLQTNEMASVKPSFQKESEKIVRYTARELIENQELLEELFLNALISVNTSQLKGYSKLYRLVKNRDQSLIDWANAVLLRDVDLNQSIEVYRNLITVFPDNPFIRFQLAETLFHNQNFESAKQQFEKLRASSNNAKDIQVYNRFIENINRQDEWNFAFGFSFLNDKNLANSAKEGTVAYLPNGSTLTYSTPRQSGQGLSAWINANKRWHSENGRYVAFDSSVAGKYYWDNKYYNEVNTQIGLGVGYANARWGVEFMPTFQKRWFAGGVSQGKSLKSYMNTYGFDLSANYWLNQKFKYSLQYSYGDERYKSESNKRQYDGLAQSLTHSITYLPNIYQYWGLSFDIGQKKAKDLANAYRRAGVKVTWGQEWKNGLSSTISFGVAKRHYKVPSFIGVKQKNNEYFASASLWHKKVHYKGFTPKVTYNYTKTQSNVPIYQYDKHQVFFNISKSF